MRIYMFNRLWALIALACHLLPVWLPSIYSSPLSFRTSINLRLLKTITITITITSIDKLTLTSTASEFEVWQNLVTSYFRNARIEWQLEDEKLSLTLNLHLDLDQANLAKVHDADDQNIIIARENSTGITKGKASTKLEIDLREPALLTNKAEKVDLANFAYGAL